MQNFMTTKIATECKQGINWLVPNQNGNMPAKQNPPCTCIKHMETTPLSITVKSNRFITTSFHVGPMSSGLSFELSVSPKSIRWTGKNNECMNVNGWWLVLHPVSLSYLISHLNPHHVCKTKPATDHWSVNPHFSACFLPGPPGSKFMADYIILY